MTRQATRKSSTTAVDLKPLGSGGVNVHADPVLLPGNTLAVGRNVVEVDGVERRLGSTKIEEFDDSVDGNGAHGAKVFGSDTKYADFTPPPVPLGSIFFLFHIHFILPVSGTRTIQSSWVDAGETERVVNMTISSAGLFTITVEWDDNSTTVLEATVADTAEWHGLLVYDEKLSVLSLYANGDLVDSASAGGATHTFNQAASAVWNLGLEVTPGTGPKADTYFTGHYDGWALFSFPGVDITEEDLTLDPPRRSLLWQFRRGNWQDWPNADSNALIFLYTMDEEQTEEPDTTGEGIMYDSSNRQNHGVYNGVPTSDDRVARRAQNGQFLGTVRRAAVGALRDGRVNIAVVGGGVYAEILQNA